jgi:hypothetical protein
LFDLNGDQGDLTKWWKLRGEPSNPRLIEVEHISRDVEVLRNEKFDWLLIDCPPLDLDVNENSILKSDAVVIPVRTGFFDICRHARGGNLQAPAQAIQLPAGRGGLEDAEAGGSRNVDPCE